MASATGISTDLTLDVLRQLGELAKHPAVAAAAERCENSAARVETLAAQLAAARARAQSAHAGLAKRDAQREVEVLLLDQHDPALRERNADVEASRATQHQIHEIAAPVLWANFLTTLDALTPRLQAALAALDDVQRALDLDDAWAEPAQGSYVGARRAVPGSYSQACGRLRQAVRHWLDVVVPGTR